MRFQPGASLLLLFLLLGWAVAPAGARGGAAPASRPSMRSGDIREHHGFESKVLRNQRRLWVYLPPGYAASDERYPVLYMHDGQNLFDAATSFAGEWGCDETAQRLIAADKIVPLIIVGIDNTPGRMDEYTPTRDARYGAGGRGDAYARFVVNEVKPFVDRTYRTRPGRDDTAIAGSSLGGLISLHIALTRPEVFSRVGILSPSLQWDDGQLLKQAAASDPALLRRFRFWVDIGTSEGSAQSAERAVRLTRELAGVFGAAGLKEGEGYRYVEERDAPHHESAWGRRFATMLMFFFPKQGG